MTLPCNIRVASRKAKIGFVFAQRGLVMEACSSFFLPRLVGHARALHLVTTGSVYPASDRLFEGLFSEVCEGPQETVRRALEIADLVATKTSAVSQALNKALVWRTPPSAEGAHLIESRILLELFSNA